MRRLILSMSVSLDGFVARPDGMIDWFAKPGARTPAGLISATAYADGGVTHEYTPA